MTIQLSTAVRNTKAGALETNAGASPLLRIRTGAQPANCAAARSGTVLVSITLPADWLTAPSAGGVALNGTWQGTASAAGTAAHYEIMDAAGTTCHEQGSVTATGGGGDLTLDNVSIANGQQVTITGFTRTEGNA